MVYDIRNKFYDLVPSARKILENRFYVYALSFVKRQRKF